MLAPTLLFDAAVSTGGFAARALRFCLLPGGDHPEVPVLTPTPGLVMSMFAEELMLVAASVVDRRVHDEDELRRIGDDTDRALQIFDTNGWLDDPASYHQAPPPPQRVKFEPGEFRGVEYRRLSFASGYQPADGLPGSDRWLAQEANQRGYAHVLEHRGKPRPWLVLVHGFGMGSPADLVFLRGLDYYRDGFNVLAPVLPLHGPRRAGRMSGGGLLSVDWVANVHALTQTVWDVRRCLAWIRERGAPAIAVHGLSLGGYTTALLAGLDGQLDCVVAGAPPATIHRPLTTAFARNPWLRRTMERHGLLGDRTEAVHKVVTATALPCRVPHERRFIYAGAADRLATPTQSYLLWEHWEKPTIHWVPGAHLFTARSPEVHRFVRDAVNACAP